MPKRESGVRKATGSYRTYSIPCKTAALVTEFAVEDLPSAELQPRFLRSKALGFGLDGPGSIPGVGKVEIFLHSVLSRLVLGFTQQ